MKARKYKLGEKVKTIADFDSIIDKNGCVFFIGKVLNTAFIQNWQYHFIRLRIKNGQLYFAERIKED
jgi:hypothetical protein